MKKSTLNTILALAFVAIAGYLFFWSWQTASKESKSRAQAVQIFKVVNISDVKDQADKLFVGKANDAGMPIPEPKAKEGKNNPFSAPE